MIQDKKIAIPAGAEVPVQGVGTFVGVLDVSDTTQELRVSATNSDGQQVLSARMLQGERVTLDKRFNQLRIKNEGVEDVEVLLLVGSGKFESGRLTGSVALENTVSIEELAGSRLASLGGIEPVNLGNFTNYFINNIATTTPIEIVAPSGNVNGLLIARADLCYGVGTIMVKQSQVTAWNDGDARLLVAVSTNGSGMLSTHKVKNVLIPAGFGLYVTSGNSIGLLGVIDYKVL